MTYITTAKICFESTDFKNIFQVLFVYNMTVQMGNHKHSGIETNNLILCFMLHMDMRKNYEIIIRTWHHFTQNEM